ncbi:Protein C16E9.2 a, partial [Aphelenchoides avenae]
VFSDVIVTEGECVCVELVARDRYRDRQAVIFLGSIRYDVLKKLYDSRGSTTWNWAQKIMSSERRRHEFVKMRGPHGKGFAEMAVARVASCGFETPMSEGGYDMSMSLDAEYANTRRMSDTNLFNRWTNSLSRRPVMTPGPQPCATPTFQPAARNRRWQSDSDNVNQDSDLEVRSVTGAPASSAGSTWSMKGIGSALKWLSDKKESTPLNAYLTYVTLPWASILEDLLSPSARKPILTFDLDFLDHQS